MKKYILNHINIIFVIFVFTMLPLLMFLTVIFVGTAQSPDTMLFYSKDDLLQLAPIYGSSGALFYLITRLTFDLTWPIVYFSFLYSNIKKLKTSDTSKSRILGYLVIAVVFDLLENITVSVVFLTYPNQPNLFVLMAESASSLKWIFLFGVIIGLIYYILKGRKQNGRIS